MKTVEAFEEELNIILKDLNRQLYELDNNPDNDFHNNLIEIIANNPDSKDIIQFMVEINDKLETKNSNLKEIINSSLKDIIIKKIDMYREVKNVISGLEKPTKTFMLKEIKNILKNWKISMVMGFGILFLMALFIMPDKLILILKLLLSIHF